MAQTLTWKRKLQRTVIRNTETSCRSCCFAGWKFCFVGCKVILNYAKLAQLMASLKIFFIFWHKFAVEASKDSDLICSALKLFSAAFHYRSLYYKLFHTIRTTRIRNCPFSCRWFLDGLFINKN